MATFGTRRAAAVEYQPAFRHIGLSCDSSVLIGRVLELSNGAIPEYPGSRIIPQIIVKPPPCISSTLEKLDRVKYLAEAYRSVVRQKYGKMSWFMCGDVEAHEQFEFISNAADWMIENHIPPMAWVLFAFEHFMGCAVRPPTTKRVFGGLTGEKLKWFESVAESYQKEKVRFCQEQLLLISDWHRMWQEIFCSSPKTRFEIMAIVDYFFPIGSYESRVLKAREEVERTQRRIDRSLSFGGSALE